MTVNPGDNLSDDLQRCSRQKINSWSATLFKGVEQTIWVDNYVETFAGTTLQEAYCKEGRTVLGHCKREIDVS